MYILTKDQKIYDEFVSVKRFGKRIYGRTKRGRIHFLMKCKTKLDAREMMIEFMFHFNHKDRLSLEDINLRK